MKKAAALPTPRAADGHPDLSGFWQAGTFVNPLAEGTPEVSADGKTLQLAITNERGVCDRYKDAYRSSSADASLRPDYKPEYAAKVHELLTGKQSLDPAFRCLPEGVPRMGPPNEIAQTPMAMYFLYSGRNLRRVIPTDGRAHDPDSDYMPMGDAVGHWEKDVFVVDITKLSEDTWLDKYGSFHDKNLHVVERYTRQGNTLKYEVTVEDPTLFTKPWTPAPVTRLLGKPGQHVTEDYPCIDSSTPNIVNTDRH